MAHPAGPRLMAGELRRWPVVTIALVTAELVVYGLVLAASEQRTPAPDVLASGWRKVDALHAGQTWRLLSCLWLHAGWGHLAVNLAALAHVGTVVERRRGAATVMIWFVVGGLAGAAAGIGWEYISVGCSGALVAMLVAHLVAERRWGDPLGVWLVVLLLGGFWLPSVDQAAHLGGAAAGVGLGLLAGALDRRRLLRRAGAIIAAGALFACSIPMLWALWPLQDMRSRAPADMGLKLPVPVTWLTIATSPERTVYQCPGAGLAIEVQRLPVVAEAGAARSKWLLARHAGARLLGGPRLLGENANGELWWLRVEGQVLQDEYVWCRARETVVLTGVAGGDTIRRYAPVFRHAAESLVVKGRDGE